MKSTMTQVSNLPVTLDPGVLIHTQGKIELNLSHDMTDGQRTKPLPDQS